MKKLFTKKSLKKNIIAVVALIEVILLSAVSVFAWTETISSLKILTQQDGAVESAINNTANINATDTALNLDSYFNESGNVHLASCSSPDGKNFYFPVKASTGTSAPKFRKGNLNDKNVNYISFSLKIKAESADRTFYFRQSPTIKINGQAVGNTDNSVRMAFFLNDESKGIFANSNASATPINSISGSTTTVSVKSFADYSLGKTELFTVGTNQTATLTVSLWLEDPDCRKESSIVSVEGLELITNAQKTTRFTFVDRTTAFNDQNDADVNAWHWVENDNAVIWLNDGSKSYQMTKNGESDEWIVNINANSYTTSTNLTFYRTASTVTDPVADASDSTKVFNKWTTTYQTDKMTYSAYGASYDTSGNCRGTWDEVAEITLNAENTDTAKAVLPIPSTSSTNKAAHIKLLYKENNTDISVEMCYYNGMWRCYIPSSVTNLGFYAETAEGADTSTLKHTSTALDRKSETAYTVTSQNTGYWGTGVLVKASVDSSCTDYGTVDVKLGSYSVNGYRVTKGSSVTFTATANSGYQFKQWTAGSTTNTSSSVTVTANSDLTYVAFFIDYYKLTLHSRVTGSTADSTTGGTVKLTNGGTSGSTAVYKAKKGTVVTLESVFTATPNANYEIDGWYNSSGQSISTVTLNDDTDVYVRFKLKSFTITAHSRVNGEDADSTYGGTVKLKNGTAGATAQYTAEYGSTVTLNNMFDIVADQNYESLGWFDESGNSVSGDTNITVSSAMNYYVKFKQTKVTIYFNKNNNNNWNNIPYAYVWDNNYSGEKYKTPWPGTEMTADSDMYKIQIPLTENGKTYTHIIFNNNKSPQTADLAIPTNIGYVKYVLNQSSNAVTVYVKNKSGSWIQQ